MQDDKIKELLSGTKMKAGESLKYRIMQQIETEKALIPKKNISARPVIKNMLTTFGVMYALIAIVGMAVYSTSGQSGLSSATFLVPVVLISSVCSMFWMISVYDDRRRSKHKAK
ncbi:hypothetical protein IR083_17505 [Dysgonomonas sp. GY75]|uniref:hypothetical protein n=1 Tax=Dysgonomonas sp. GY75 TaxID=2780419 RepID=UPI0018840AB5|nr:hypothetical protein [Dysgonomonas sp. GY75]MBF0650622.1 hypothetical protein [Dysgonomonas sp. GY75]